MSDLQLSEWSAFTIGHQWPNSSVLATLSAAEKNRQRVAESFDNYGNILNSIRFGSLGTQEGLTAEAARSAFQSGEKRSIEIADRNQVAASAYRSAADAVQNLRTQLEEVDLEAKNQINKVRSSDEPHEIKLQKIITIIAQARASADSSAASNSECLFGAIQSVLDKSQVDSSSRQFAHTNGFSSLDPSPPLDHGTITRHLDAVLEDKRDVDKPHGVDSQSISSVLSSGITHPSASPISGDRNAPSKPIALSETARRGATSTSPQSTEPTLPTLSRAMQNGSTSPSTLADSYHASPSQIQTASPNTTNLAAGAGVSLGASSPTASSPTQISSLPSPAPTSQTSPDSLLQALTPTHAGLPIPSIAEALSNASAEAAPHHAAPNVAPFAPLAAPTIPSAAPMFETAHAASPPIDAQPMSHGPSIQPVTAAPPVIREPISPAPTLAPSSLPGYGADARPPAVAPSLPAPASPTSAPMAAHATGAHAQPAVVRQQPVVPTAPKDKSIVAEKAYAATATGAAAGKLSADAAAQKRLQQLLAAVARQEPKLRWAIGDHNNGTTILVTDIASGWIPPHVEIPTGLTLIQPTSEAVSLEAMLAGTTRQAIYEPGQHIPTHREPVPTSTRVRATKPLDDLAWSLIQATKWRDGLPRLAHTLAKAATAKTGCLDSEVDLLREHLKLAAKEALEKYPNTSPKAVGNWQLLAAIEALLDRERTCANYHLAWFESIQTRPNYDR